MAEYIERETLISELSASCMPIDDREISGLFDCDESIRDIIDAIPAADVRPERHGYWSDKMIAVPQKNKVGYHEDDYAFGFQCSECGEILNKTAYCGNCGAKMDGKDDE